MFLQKSSVTTFLCLSATTARAFTRTSNLPLRRSFVATSLASQASASAPPPTQYLLTYDYVADVLEKRGPYREEHLQLAKDLIAQGKCSAGGPISPLQEGATPTGALFVFTDLEAAKSFVEKDPYVSGGIVTKHSIEAWTVAVSKEGF